jgi:hypothetical protein
LWRFRLWLRSSLSRVLKTKRFLKRERLLCWYTYWGRHLKFTPIGNSRLWITTETKGSKRRKPLKINIHWMSTHIRNPTHP